MVSHKNKENGFEVKCRPLTYEEKIERAEDYNDFYGERLVDPEIFAKEEIYDPSVEMKCLNCDFEDELDLDEVLEYQEMTGDEDYAMFCPYCGEEQLVPKSIYKEKKPPKLTRRKERKRI